MFRLFLKNLYWRNWSKKKQINKNKKKTRSEKVLKKQLIEESDDNDEVVSKLEENNSTDDSSEPDDEMETGSINGNFNNVFYSPAGINLHTFLPTQVDSALSMS